MATVSAAERSALDFIHYADAEQLSRAIAAVRARQSALGKEAAIGITAGAYGMIVSPAEYAGIHVTVLETPRKGARMVLVVVDERDAARLPARMRGVGAFKIDARCVQVTGTVPQDTLVRAQVAAGVGRNGR